MDVHQDLSYGASWSRRANRTTLKVKQSPRSVNPSICRFSFSLVQRCFSDLNFRCQFCQIFSWMSVKTLAIESVGHDRKPIHFQVHGFFGDPDFRRHFCRNFSWPSVKTLAMESVGHDGQINPFSRLNKPRSE
ncbi:hypothetical protein H5410_058955 [Solanum commersonii]|uniref:Uncharacterized protein n=1 Tax=Solanum commersonii TaxID=4109 RepID=A0A9J5W121_SOLCO|nr:hypothetical protein H5410_058955 [Solanum commersonii]